MKRKFPWWLVLILLANLIVHLIPQEWITGPAPSLSAVESVRQEAASRAAQWLEPAEEILLDESRWLGLGDREKIRVLERFAQEQAGALGLRKHLDVEVADLEEGLAGQYDNETAAIQIDDACFRNYRPEKLAYVICHEVRHAYQFALAEAWVNLCEGSPYADLELFGIMEDCYEGLNHYHHASEDRDAYRSQWVEEDAREYADREMTRILMGEER